MKFCFLEGQHSFFFSNISANQGSSARLVLPATSSYLGQTEGLAGNSKPIYEVCDSKSEKSALMTETIMIENGGRIFFPASTYLEGYNFGLNAQPKTLIVNSI